MKKIIKSSLVYGLAALGLVSCSNNKQDYGSDRYSENVGFDFGAPENGGLPALAFDSYQEIPENMVYIEGGLFVMGQIQQDVMGGVRNTPSTVHVKSFYLDDTEVTNREYLIYLDWLQKVYPPNNPKYKHIYKAALPDENVWKNPLGSDGGLSKTYLKSIAYEDYPVVGVSWRQANDYCKWRTDRVAEMVLIADGILKPYNERGISEQGRARFDAEVFELDPKLLFNGDYSIFTEYVTRPEEEEETDSIALATPVKKEDIKLNIEKYSPMPNFRLPTEAEWEYAAKADVENREYNTIRGRKKYAWSGETTIDAQSAYGVQFANFKQSKGDYSGIAGWSSDNGDITTPVKSFPPNAFGLYDMAGNVAEWVADVYRPVINTEANDFNYYRGNVFKKMKFDESGKVVLVDVNNMVYDTLPNGKIVPSALPGEIVKEEISISDAYMNPNINKADNIDFADGDLSSSRDYEEEDPEARKPMYNSPVIPQPVLNEKTGQMELKYDAKPRTSLITKYSRVYKGGSWQDREFWLDPAQRKFLEEYMSTNYIGFRCAVSKIGASHEDSNRSPYGAPAY
ncbi:gliding motility lipoprotein GldJ [Wenyingzhuangia sp. IMCC45533]